MTNSSKIFLLLSQSPSTPDAIGSHLGLAKPEVNRMLGALQSASFVEETRTILGGKAPPKVLVYWILTPKGWAHHENLKSNNEYV